MTARSSIARHPLRVDIEAALRSGESLRTIANRFDVSRSALFRFKDTLPGPTTETAGRMPPPVLPVRTRSRPPDPADDAMLPPDEARLRDVSWMRAKGASRAEIAAKYRVTENTVSEWLRRARERGLNRVRSITRDEVVATVFEDHEIRMAEIKTLFDTAKASGDRRSAIEALKLWQTGDRHKIDMARDLGVFEGPAVLGAAPAGDNSSHAAMANILMGIQTLATSDDKKQLADEIRARTAEAQAQRLGATTTATEAGQQNPPINPKSD